MISFGLVAIGLAGLIIGGEFLIRGAVSVANTFKISPMVIGVTLVGFGTSTPELVTSLQAALTGSPGIAIGNVVGSNIANILLILGIAAALAPVAVDPLAFRRDGSVMLAATLACVGVVLMDEIGRIAGGVFVAALIAYLTYTLWSEQQPNPTPAAAVFEAEAEAIPGPETGLLVSILLAIGGLVLLIFGARFLVMGAVDIAQMAGVSEVVIGLTVVAIGTSMPELVTSIIAVRKGQGDVALGNVLGSNVFNILGILGITAVVTPMDIPAEIIRLDIWVMLAATLVMLIFARTGWTISRREGGLFVLAYVGYLGVLVAMA